MNALSIVRIVALDSILSVVFIDSPEITFWLVLNLGTLDAKEGDSFRSLESIVSGSNSEIKLVTSVISFLADSCFHLGIPLTRGFVGFILIF